MSCDRERRVADVPDFLLLGLVLDEVAGVALRLHLVDQRGGLGGGFVGAGSAEFGDEPRMAVGQHFQIAEFKPLLLHVPDQHMVDALESNRLRL